MVKTLTSLEKSGHTYFTSKDHKELTDEISRQEKLLSSLQNQSINEFQKSFFQSNEDKSPIGKYINDYLKSPTQENMDRLTLVAQVLKISGADEIKHIILAKDKTPDQCIEEVKKKDISSNSLASAVKNCFIEPTKVKLDHVNAELRTKYAEKHPILHAVKGLTSR